MSFTQSLLVLTSQPALNSFSLENVPEWILTSILALQAGTMTKKEMRKLRWKMAWQSVKAKFRKGKKPKSTWDEGNKGLFIASAILGLASLALILLLGGGTLLIIIAAFLLLPALFQLIN